MSSRRKYGATAEIYFQSQEQIDQFRALAVAQGLTLSTFIRQLLIKAQEGGAN